MGTPPDEDGRETQEVLHTVAVTPFYMSRYEVTQAEWQRVMGHNPSQFQDCGPRCPVENVNWFEVQQFIRRLNADSQPGFRLPTEAEWEFAARRLSKAARPHHNFADRGAFHPLPQADLGKDEPVQMYGDVWEWTQSNYNPYPGFQPLAGAVGEYNGKFMCNQFVLRGGSCATPAGHVRASYRNFFPPDAQWQFSGVRLARDAATS